MPEHKYKKFKLKITVQTPLHIGTGRTLLNSYDHSVYNSKTWRINEDILLSEQKVENAAAAEMLARQKPADLLDPKKGDYTRSDLFLYTLAGIPISSDQSIREQVKNSGNLPYIPGSSLKGALRTALGWHAWQEKKYSPDIEKTKDWQGRFKRKEFAGQEFEKDIFGKKPGGGEGSDPNYDLMRALQVGDSSAAPKSALTLINAAVMRRTDREPDKISSLEAIAHDAEFTLDLKIDTHLFSDWAKKRGFQLANADPNAENWLTGFVNICRNYASARIQEELDYYNTCRHSRANTAKRLYERFKELNETLAENKFRLQLGWGTGWDSKTFGGNLRSSDSFMSTILKEYRLSRNHPETTPDEYPMTRRLVCTEQKKLTDPLGWVLVEVIPGETA